MTGFELPRRLPTYRLRLRAHYASRDQQLLCELIGKSHASVIEETTHDNLDGGTYGHDVKLFLPMEELSKVGIDDIKQVTQQLREDLNKLGAGVANEHFDAVHLELFDENDEVCRRARPLHSRPDRDPDALTIWTHGMLRLFISHRDEHKAMANELADALEPYGISSFVAHDSIHPMTIWQTEILNGLESMEIMLALVTDDFHESVWTNQELGFALGRNIPIVPLKMQRRDPDGFVGKHQALKCRYDNVAAAAPKVYRILADKLGNRERLQTSLVRAFVNSPDFSETKRRFDRMTSVVSELSDSEFDEIVAGFRESTQLHKAIYLNDKYRRLTRFVRDATGREAVIDGRKISIVDGLDDDIPF